MNFLDAHKICYDYAGIFAQGNKYGVSLWYPLSSVPFKNTNWKKMVISAHKIVLAHTILFNELTNEEIDQMRVLLMQLNNFADDAYVKQEVRCFEIIKNTKRPLYKLFHKKDVEWADDFFKTKRKNTELFFCDELDDVWNELLAYKKDVFMLKYNRILEKKGRIPWEDLIILIESFTLEAYKLSGIDYDDSYVNFFLGFDTMRRLLDGEETKGFYVGYEEYIRKFDK